MVINNNLNYNINHFIRFYKRNRYFSCENLYNEYEQKNLYI